MSRVFSMSPVWAIPGLQNARHFSSNRQPKAYVWASRVRLRLTVQQIWLWPIAPNIILLVAVLCAIANVVCGVQDRPAKEMLAWNGLPPRPDELGVAGPFAGIHDDVLIVAGGANFPLPVWENEKAWLDRVYVLDLNSESPTWSDGGKLTRPMAYGAAVSVPDGVVCIGGADATSVFREVFLLQWDRSSEALVRMEFPPLPEPRSYGSATLVGNTIWFSGGQGTTELVSAQKNLWSLDLSVRSEPGKFVWEKHEPCPGPPRAFHLTVGQHNGFDNCVYVISGRNQAGDDVGFLRDTWEYNMVSHRWRKRADVPNCVMAGTAISLGQSHIFVLGGAAEELFFRGNELKDEHPGLPLVGARFDIPAGSSWHPAGAGFCGSSDQVALRHFYHGHRFVYGCAGRAVCAGSVDATGQWAGSADRSSDRGHCDVFVLEVFDDQRIPLHRLRYYNVCFGRIRSQHFVRWQQSRPDRADRSRIAAQHSGRGTGFQPVRA